MRPAVARTRLWQLLDNTHGLSVSRWAWATGVSLPRDFWGRSMVAKPSRLPASTSWRVPHSISFRTGCRPTPGLQAHSPGMWHQCTGGADVREVVVPAPPTYGRTSYAALWRALTCSALVGRPRRRGEDAVDGSTEAVTRQGWGASRPASQASTALCRNRSFVPMRMAGGIEAPRLRRLYRVWTESPRRSASCVGVRSGSMEWVPVALAHASGTYSHRFLTIFYMAPRAASRLAGRSMAPCRERDATRSWSPIWIPIKPPAVLAKAL